MAVNDSEVLFQKEVRGGSRAGRGGPKAFPAKNEKHKNTHRNVWGPCAKPTTQLQPAFCAASSSRPKWLKVPTPSAARPLNFEVVGGGEVKPPNTVQHATQGSADIV